MDINIKELIVQVMKELKEQDIPMNIRKNILASLCYCILESVRYDGICY